MTAATATPTPARISATWRITPNDRRATLGRLTLISTNGRTQQGWGPVVWCVVRAGEVVASGEVWQGTEYSALVRQAMLEAERAAEASCERAPSGSLYPAEATWSTTARQAHCRSCGRELSYSKLGRLEHRAGAL